MNGTGQNGEKRTRLHNHLNKWFEIASRDYGMIEPGDRILVGVSGGTDSMALLDLLRTPKYSTPGDYSILVVHIDLGFDGSGEDSTRLEAYLKETEIDCVIDRTDIGPLSHSDYNKKNPCFLCSRLRRKRIFEIAGERGCNKIALAHHRDDMIETLLLNMFYSREISTMMPKQQIFGGTLHIIRPLAYIREALVKKFARERKFPVVGNRCPTSGNSRRRYIKELLNALEKDNPIIRDNLFRAMKNVKKDYMPGGNKVAKKESGEKPICQNKTARLNFEIEDTFEAGIALVGTEVKALREGKGNLTDSFARVKNGEVFLHEMNISPYTFGNIMNHEPLRVRKLLLHKQEIRKLYSKTQEKGQTVIPLKAYFKNGKVKILLGVGRGKKTHDRRQDLKKRTDKREMERAIRGRGR